MELYFEDDLLRQAYVYSDLNKAEAMLILLDDGFAIKVKGTFMVHHDESRDSKIVTVKYSKEFELIYVNVYTSRKSLQVVAFDTNKLVNLTPINWEEEKCPQ